MDDDSGTPARDHQDGEAFDRDTKKDAVSDQQSETAPAGADRPKDGDDAGADPDR